MASTSLLLHSNLLKASAAVAAASIALGFYICKKRLPAVSDDDRKHRIQAA